MDKILLGFVYQNEAAFSLCKLYSIGEKKVERGEYDGHRNKSKRENAATPPTN